MVAYFFIADVVLILILSVLVKGDFFINIIEFME